MKILINKRDIKDPPLEFVERKGLGHPDSLADALAENLSVEYSKYTLDRFGAVLHHNFDKIGLLGGASHVEFGNGRLVKPIRVLLNGRASISFGNKKIPVENLLKKWSKIFFKSRLPIDPERDLEFHFNLSSQSSPGKTQEKESKHSKREYWFKPRSLDDIPELSFLFSNDTSMGVGYSPLSKLESLVLVIEKHLNSEFFKKNRPWLGSDIKIMGVKDGHKYYITMCVPQIAAHVGDLLEYRENLEDIKGEIFKIAKKVKVKIYELDINTRDNYENKELYLTAVGSSIESGDEGLVGRGNRVNGLISPFKPLSMEGACGKNPVYHVGKLYYLCAFKLANKINKMFGVKNEVALVSQSGRSLIDPWVVSVTVPKSFKRNSSLVRLVEREIQKIPKITAEILREELSLF